MRSSAEGAHVQLACRWGPASVSTVPALSSTVCASGMGTAALAPVDDRPSWPIRHTSPESARPRAQAPQIVKADRRVGLGQVNVAVQITQQSVGQAVGQGSKLLFGIFDHRPQRRRAAQHLRPAQPTEGRPDVQSHRVLGGEPADGARQVDC